MNIVPIKNKFLNNSDQWYKKTFWKYVIKVFLKNAKQHKIMNKKYKVAFIGNYKTNCGVSTYNYELINHLKKNCELKVFAENNLNSNDPDFVIRCWDREDNIKKYLIDEVIKYDPDIIHISHEYGIFSKAYQFTSLCSIFKNLNYKVLTTLHSVYEHLDKTVTEIAPDFLIIHTEQAKACLLNKGISEDKIYVIPHGTDSPETGELLPNLYNTWHNEHTIYHPGFLFRYKGHLVMLDVLLKLKQKYPDVHYIIQGSENERNKKEHDSYYNEIVEKIKQYGLENNVSINRGFIDRRLIMNSIRTVKVCVLPYSPHPDHDVYASSGIARMVLTTETPLITSYAHIFDDISTVADKAHTVDEFVEKISNVFNSNSEKQIQNKLKKEFLKIINWTNIAKLTTIVYEDILKRS